MGRYREITSRAVGQAARSDSGRPSLAGLIVYAMVASASRRHRARGRASSRSLGDMIDGTPAIGSRSSRRCGARSVLATATVVALVADAVRPRRPRACRGHPAARGCEPRASAHEGADHARRRARTRTRSRRRTSPRRPPRSIGADALLTRVGAYYHDIGKIRRPVYFFENQQPGFNPHDEAQARSSRRSSSPRTCSDGLELAKKYRLPPKILDIIRQHHGTTLVRYFYNKAAALDAGVFEADFRYQGEKPTSREAALVMLADSSEAAVRALKQPTEPRVRGGRAGDRRGEDRRRSARRSPV